MQCCVHYERTIKVKADIIPPYVAQSLYTAQGVQTVRQTPQKFVTVCSPLTSYTNIQEQNTSATVNELQPTPNVSDRLHKPKPALHTHAPVCTACL